MKVSYNNLESTRLVSIQMAPQIRLLQNADQEVVDKLRSDIINTIPLWRNQMVLALGIEHSRRALDAQSAVTEMTNEMFHRNAETLNELAELCNKKVGDFAEICNEGVGKMADLMYSNGDSYDTYEGWAQKLMNNYNDIAQDIMDAYLDSAM